MYETKCEANRKEEKKSNQIKGPTGTLNYIECRGNQRSQSHQSDEEWMLV